MVYTSNRDGGGSVPSGHLAHPPPEGRLRRTGIFTVCRAGREHLQDEEYEEVRRELIGKSFKCSQYLR